MLDRSSILASNDFARAEDITSSKTRDIAAKKILKFFLINSLRNKIILSMSAAKEYRQLMQNYASTAELAEAYNKADVFVKRIEIDGKVEFVNPQRDQLLEIAREILNKNASKDSISRSQIFEIANLSSIDNDDFSEDIYNALMKDLDSLNPGNTGVIKLAKMEGIIRMLRLLPPGFLSKKHPDIAFNTLNKISQWLNSYRLGLKSSEEESKQLISILEIYARIADSLVDSSSLQRINIPISYSRRVLRNVVAVGMPVISLAATIFFWREMLIYASVNTLKLAIGFCVSVGETISLTKPKQIELSKVISSFKSHHNIQVRYLSNYIIESISRLTEKSDTDFSRVFKKSVHLILGANSFFLLTQSPLSLFAYRTLFKQAADLVEGDQLISNSWYNSARILLAMIEESQDDLAKLKFALGEVISYHNSVVSPRWEIIYILLKSLSKKANNHADNEIKIEVISLSSRVALDPRYARLFEIQKAAIYVLLDFSSSPEKEVVKVSHKYIHRIYQNITQPKKGVLFNSSTISNFPKPLISIMSNISSLEFKSIDQVTSTPVLNELLYSARCEILPITEMGVFRVRQKILASYIGPSLNNDVSMYMPLTGLEAKKCISLESRVKSFIEEKSLEEGIPTLFIYSDVNAILNLFTCYLEKKYWMQYEQAGVIPLLVPLHGIRDLSGKVVEQALSYCGFTKDEIISLQVEKHKNKGGYRKFLCVEKASNGRYVRDMQGRLVVKESIREDSSPRLLIILYGNDNIENLINIKSSYEASSWFNVKVIVSTCADNFVKMHTRNLFTISSEEIAIKIFDEHQIRSLILNNLLIWQKSTCRKSQIDLTKEHLERLVLGKKDFVEVIRYYLVLSMLREILPTKRRLTVSHSHQYGALSYVADQINNIEAYGNGTNGLTRYQKYDLLMKSCIRAVESLLIEFNMNNFTEDYITLVSRFIFELDIKKIDPGINFSYTTNSMSSTSNRLTYDDMQEFLVAKEIVKEIRDIVKERDNALIGASIINKYYLQKDSSILFFILDEVSLIDLEVLEAVILLPFSYMQKYEIKATLFSANIKTIFDRLNDVQGCKMWITSMYVNEPYAFLGAEDKIVRVIHLENDERLRELKGHTDIVNVIYANNNYIFSGSEDKTVRIWSISSGKTLKVLTGHTAAITSVHANEYFLLSIGAWDNAVKELNIDTKNSLIKSLDQCHRGDITSAYTNDDRIFSGSEDKTVRIWSVSLGFCLKILKGYPCQINNIDANYLSFFSATYMPCDRKKNIVRVMDICTGKCKYKLKGYGDFILILHANYSYMFLGNINGIIEIWHAVLGRFLNVLRGHDVGVIGLFSTRSNLISADLNGIIVVWDIVDIENVKIVNIIRSISGTKISYGALTRQQTPIGKLKSFMGTNDLAAKAEDMTVSTSTNPLSSSRFMPARSTLQPVPSKAGRASEDLSSHAAEDDWALTPFD